MNERKEERNNELMNEGINDLTIRKRISRGLN